MYRALVASTLVLAAATPAAAVNVINGSFETATLAGAPVGWTVFRTPSSVGSTIVSSTQAYAGLTSLRFRTGVLAGVPNTRGVFQNVSGFNVGQNYVMRYWALNQGPAETNPNYGLFNNSLTVTVGSTGSQVFGKRAPFGWTMFSVPFKALATTEQVRFAVQHNGGGPNNYFYIDRVAFSVPEPATWAMLIAGFGMVGAAARRRRRVVAA